MAVNIRIIYIPYPKCKTRYWRFYSSRTKSCAIFWQSTKSKIYR